MYEGPQHNYHEGDDNPEQAYGYPNQPHYEGQPYQFEEPYAQGPPLPPPQPQQRYNRYSGYPPRHRKSGMSSGMTILLIMGIMVTLMILQVVCFAFCRRPGPLLAVSYLFQLLFSCIYAGLGYFLCREKSAPPIVGAILGFLLAFIGVLIVVVLPDKPRPRSRHTRTVTQARLGGLRGRIR